eukprot:8699489-Alexandrium_andersonii.AAC.1
MPETTCEHAGHLREAAVEHRGTHKPRTVMHPMLKPTREHAEPSLREAAVKHRELQKPCTCERPR